MARGGNEYSSRSEGNQGQQPSASSDGPRQPTIGKGPHDVVGLGGGVHATGIWRDAVCEDGQKHKRLTNPRHRARQNQSPS